MYVLSVLYGDLSALFFSKKRVELGIIAFALGSTDKTVVLVHSKDFLHCII